MQTPYEKIRELTKNLPVTPPRHWERLGDVIILRMEKSEYEDEIGAIYAKVLRARTVVVEERIEGIKRKPRVRKICGDGTETIARENGIIYKLDVSRVMFSSGNEKERFRMGRIVKEGEKVLDMFAGIGYFSIPMGKIASVWACELNEDAFHYLNENIELNRSDVRASLGDNRVTVPDLEIEFQRVVMGYLRDTHEFLPTALNALDDGGIIHYHEATKNSHDVIKRVNRVCRENGREIKKIGVNRIKSIAPGVVHHVFDLFF